MKTLRFLGEHLESFLVSILLAALTLLMLGAALERHLSPEADSRALRAAGDCLAWLVFMGIPCAAAEASHLRVTFLERRFSAGERQTLAVFAAIAFLIFALIGAVVAGRVFLQSLEPGNALPLKPYVYLSAPVGFALTVFRLLQRLFRLPGKAPEDD